MVSEQRAVAHFTDRHYSVASVLYLSAIALAPCHARAGSWRAHVAFCALENKQYAQAVTAYTQAINALPNDSALHCNRGVAHFFLGHSTNALADFNRALELDPLNAQARVARSRVWEQRADWAVALADMTQALQYNANPARAVQWREHAAWLHRRMAAAAVPSATAAAAAPAPAAAAPAHAVAAGSKSSPSAVAPKLTPLPIAVDV
jgi:tetratricopeptide (TPR) repeat protein